VKEEAEQIGKVYSAARIDTERFGLISSTVARLRSQAEFHDAKQKELSEECKKEDDMRKSIKKDTNDTQKRCQELQQTLNDYERRMQKKFSHNVSPEDVIALRQTCVRQHRDIVAHHGTTSASKPGSLKQALTTPFSGLNGKSIKDLTPQWQSLQEVQSNLLLEHAATTIVDLTDPGAKKSVEEQRTRLENISHKTADLKHGITGLLRSLAGADEPGGGKQSATVSLTRYLKATAEAGARGTMARVVMPMSGQKQTAARVPLPNALSVSADLDLLRSLHHAMF
jgi:chromosome segregation ATPase